MGNIMHQPRHLSRALLGLTYEKSPEAKSEGAEGHLLGKVGSALFGVYLLVYIYRAYTCYLGKKSIHVCTLLYTHVYTTVYTRVHYSALGISSVELSRRYTSRE